MINKTDEQIKVDIVDQLNWNASVDASNVKVEVSDGKVVLSGSVMFFANKKAAENSTWIIPGVKQIDNKIIVKYPSTLKIPSDNDLKRNVENVILWDADVYSFDISVFVLDGEVTLEGTVDAYWKKLHTEAIAENIFGVVNVVNKLAVIPSDIYVDKVIADNIISAIDRLDIADVEDINVEVENGTVTLSGTVSSWISKRAIENIADYTDGVVDVISFFTINY